MFPDSSVGRAVDC